MFVELLAPIGASFDALSRQRQTVDRFEENNSIARENIELSRQRLQLAQERAKASMLRAETAKQNAQTRADTLAEYQKLKSEQGISGVQNQFQFDYSQGGAHIQLRKGED